MDLKRQAHSFFDMIKWEEGSLFICIKLSYIYCRNPYILKLKTDLFKNLKKLVKPYGSLTLNFNYFY